LGLPTFPGEEQEIGNADPSKGLLNQSELLDQHCRAECCKDGVHCEPERAPYRCRKPALA
jgi:hypothetical protein